MTAITENADRKKYFLIETAYLVVILVIIYLFAKYMLGWIMPFIIGFIIAVVTRPAAKSLSRKSGMKTGLCSVLVVLTIVTLFILICVYGASRLALGLTDTVKLLPQLASQLVLLLNSVASKLSAMLKSAPNGANLGIDTSLNSISRKILELTTIEDGTGKMIQNTIKAMPGFLFNSTITVVAACFISADYPKVTGFLMRQLPQRYRETVFDLKAFFITTVAHIIKAYLKLMVITFVELALGLTILRVHHSIVIAAVISIVDVLPVLGTGTVMIPWSAVEFLLGNYYLGFGLAIVYGIITVVRNILEPKIVGGHIGLHPLVTLIAIVVGLKALGFLGMILFPIAILFLKHLRESGIIKLWKD